MLRTPFSWTDQNIAILRQMVAEGASANEIGYKLGTSRNSVIGKASRMEIALAGSRGKPSRQTGKAPKSVPRYPRPVACDEAEPVIFTPEPEVPEVVVPVEFALLEAHHCKFPIDDNIGPHMLCCGGRRLHGSYCAEHAAIARGRGTESERKATSVGRAW
jgi:GcrA cell cycle regulator